MPDSGCWAKRCETCGHRYRWNGSIGSPPPCPKCHPKPRNATRPPDKAWGPNGGNGSPKIVDPAERADEDFKNLTLEMGEEILEMIDELPSRAQDFGESAADTVRSIMESIESRGFATQGQAVALGNIQSGVEKWFAY